MVDLDMERAKKLLESAEHLYQEEIWRGWQVYPISI